MGGRRREQQGVLIEPQNRYAYHGNMTQLLKLYKYTASHLYKLWRNGAGEMSRSSSTTHTFGLRLQISACIQIKIIRLIISGSNNVGLIQIRIHIILIGAPAHVLHDLRHRKFSMLNPSNTQLRLRLRLQYLSFHSAH